VCGTLTHGVVWCRVGGVLASVTLFFCGCASVSGERSEAVEILGFLGNSIAVGAGAFEDVKLPWLWSCAPTVVMISGTKRRSMLTAAAS